MTSVLFLSMVRIIDSIDGAPIYFPINRCVMDSQIENLSKSSLQAHLFGGLSAINKGAGTAIAKIPGINKSQIDETLIEASERIGAYKKHRVQTTMRQLLERQSSCVRPFIDNINAVNRLYNEPVTLIFNHDTLYLGSTPDQT